MTGLVAKIQGLAAAFAASDLPFAFGGALALAYATEEPRATRDIDVNVFVEVVDVDRAFDALPPEVAHRPADRRTAVRDGQVRLFWEETPVDLFFSTHPFHAQAARRVRRVDLGDGMIPVLSPVDLGVFKVFFDRTKDWADLEAMLEAGSLPGGVLVGHLVDLLGPDDHRIERLRTLLGPEAPPGS